MPPTETDILLARFARMKALVDTLEDTCAVTAPQREAFLKLKQELEAARLALEPPATH